MASIKKITYQKKNGQLSNYWQVSYYDSEGRKRKNFDKQSQAHSFKVTTEGQLLSGTLIADKVTLEKASLEFINKVEKDMKAGNLERSTWKQYRGHINKHIKPYPIAQMIVSQIQPKDCRAWLDELTLSSSPKVMATLKMIFKFSNERAWMHGNPASYIKVRRDRAVKRVEIPEKAKVKMLIDAAKKIGDREHAFVCLGFFCGLRASELRGLPRSNVKKDHIIISQRADQWGKIGAPKTQKSTRKIPMGKYTAKAVHKWLGKAKGTLVFGSSVDTPIVYQNLRNRLWEPLFEAAELKETYGFHVMRHVCASLWIEQDYKPKQIQEMLGHSTIAMTMDTYGHLWQNDDAGEMVTMAEKSIMGLKKTQKASKLLKNKDT